MSIATRLHGRLFSWIRAGEIFRYGIVTVAGYTALYVATYLLVEVAQMAPQTAYPIVLTIVYVGVYLSYGAFVFKAGFTQRSLRRFLAVAALSWAANTAFFSVLTAIGLHYLLAITANIVLLGAVRFCLQRLYVFRQS